MSIKAGRQFLVFPLLRLGTSGDNLLGISVNLIFPRTVLVCAHECQMVTSFLLLKQFSIFAVETILSKASNATIDGRVMQIFAREPCLFSENYFLSSILLKNKFS